MKTSYNEATAKGCSNLELDLRLCEESGYDFIEIRLDMLKDYLINHEIKELVEFFRNSRIKPHAINALYIYSEFLGEQDDLNRQTELLNDFKLGCEVSKAIGNKYFIIVPPLQRDPNGGPFIGDKKEIFLNCVRILKELGEMAENFDINLCFELVGFNRSSVRTIEEANDIVKAVNMTNVGFVFDSYNIYLNECDNDFSKLKVVDKDKIFAVHLISGEDVPIDQMGQDKRCFPDEGVVNIDGFLQVLKNMGYEGMVSIETFNPKYWVGEPKKIIKDAYDSLKKVLERNNCL
ncbi:sugar phosphate isomerase/epimerase family protein [Fusobacterium sp. PH5-44]|uniref:sugar phosphate isomerase/epimerase family protein n=1 Tax=unclassified Fusobacterium TaxID=2648384 RepID=UPI003D21AA72